MFSSLWDRLMRHVATNMAMFCYCKRELPPSMLCQGHFVSRERIPYTVVNKEVENVKTD